MDTRIEKLLSDHNVIADEFEVLIWTEWIGQDWVKGILIEARPPKEFIDNLPEGYHAYQIRHSDDDDSVPATIERGVFVNYFGTFITSENLDYLFDESSDYREIEDWGYIC